LSSFETGCADETFDDGDPFLADMIFSFVLSMDPNPLAFWRSWVGISMINISNKRA
jgi:hypothetical protein